MLVNLHAAMFLALPVVTLLVVMMGPKRTLTDLQKMTTLLIPVAAGFLALGLNLHLCRMGNPFTQWLVPAACLWITLVFTGRTIIRRVWAALLLMSMFALSFHFTETVHGEEWVGNPQWDSHYEALARARLTAAKTRLTERAREDQADYPAGWLRDLPIAGTAEDRLEQIPPRGEIRRVWHSWFTGLYQKVTISRDLWYPGGRLAEAVEIITLKDRLEP